MYTEPTLLMLMRHEVTSLTGLFDFFQFNQSRKLLFDILLLLRQIKQKILQSKLITYITSGS